MIHKRTKAAFANMVLPAILFTAIAIGLELVIKIKDDLDPKVSSFSDYKRNNPSYAMVYPQSIASNELVQKIENVTRDLIREDTNVDPKKYYFESMDDMNLKVINMMQNATVKEDLNIIIGFSIGENISETFLPITVIYNDTAFDGNPGAVTSFEQLHRVIWNATGRGNFTVRSVNLVGKFLTQMIGKLTPFYILIGLFSLCNFYGRQAIEDLRKEKRPYMETCKLSLWNYWIGCFIADFAMWVIISLISWTILVAAGSSAFKAHPVASLYAFIIGGISIVIVTYSISFLFEEPESGASYIMMILMLPMLVVFLVEFFKTTKSAEILNWVYSAYPITNAYQFVSSLATSQLSFGEMWTDKLSFPLLIMMLANIPIYIGLLWFIEKMRVYRAKKAAESSYSMYTEFFTKRKSKQAITQEARDEEIAVQGSAPNQFAVKINKVCRLYQNNEGKPIAAVNDVSLGVKDGELYGFLGANGAGKTTMLKMITSSLPTSSGSIEIDGVDIANTSERQLLSICPQFNEHLTNEMTAVEHVKLFGAIFGVPQAEIDRAINEFIPLLELEEHKDKLVRELSGGNARKLAVLIAFLSPAHIILLDEPTSSLDPVARHKVHDLIGIFRGQKTFMLCTHLLDEAESLCDKISMMINGCVYVVGTPQYLSSRFGTEWKVDILLDNDDKDISTAVSDYVKQKIPDAKLSMQRSKNLVYSIPSSAIELAALFRFLKNGIDANIGLKYFTCSSSSLEKVFLELVLRSEEAELSEDHDAGTPEPL